jgi:hypothetical protein
MSVSNLADLRLAGALAADGSNAGIVTLTSFFTVADSPVQVASARQLPR